MTSNNRVYLLALHKMFGLDDSRPFVDKNYINPFLRSEVGNCIFRDSSFFQVIPPQPFPYRHFFYSYPLSFQLMPSPTRGYTTFPSQADLFYLCTTSSTSEEDLNIHYVPPSQSSLRVGVVVLGQDQVQLLDLAVLDLLAMLGRNRANKMNFPERAVEEALDEIDVRFVNASGEGSFPVTSGAARMPVTVSYIPDCSRAQSAPYHVS